MHELSTIRGKTLTPAVTVVCLCLSQCTVRVHVSVLCPLYSRHWGAILSADGDEGGDVAVAVALGSVALGVAQLAVDLTIRGVAGEHRVEGAVALAAVVASLVPLLKRPGDKLLTRLCTPFF